MPSLLTLSDVMGTGHHAAVTGRVFDRVIGLDEVPDGYRAMNDREAIKVMVEP